MGEVIEENGLDRHIRYDHRINSASWSSADEPLDDRGDAHRHRRASWCFTAELPVDVPGLLPPLRGLHAAVARHGPLQGRDRPPADLAGGPRLHGQAGDRHRLGRDGGDAGAGDGAEAAHVTMLQRSPTYFRTGRNANELADTLRELRRRRGRGSTRSSAARSCYDQADVHRRCFAEPELVKAGAARPVSRAYLGAGLRHRAALHARLPAVAAAHRLRPRRRPVPGHRRRQGVGRHRRDRALHETGIRLKSGEHARGRHHRHRHRLQPERAGRHRVHDRRQAAGLPRHGHLPRHDVHRHAEHGLGVRLLPRQLDAARRPDRRLRLPAAGHMDEQGAERVEVAAAAARTRTCRCCRGSTRRTSTPAT